MTMFTDPLDYYQAIADELVNVIPEKWTNIEIEAERFENSIDLMIVYFKPDETEESRVRTQRIPQYFFELARVVSDESKGLYMKCFYFLDDKGDFKVDFEY
ncbi:MAG: immunity protein YezG family protein [Candidatus Thiodiazotropha taylori]